MPIPAAPSNLVATPLTASRIDLTWLDNSSDELNFELQQSPNGTTGWALIASPVANATTHSVTGLATNTTYYYRIRAVNASGNSAYSSVASALTLNPGRAPLQPRMYLLQPATVFAARVNQPGPAAYPVSSVVYDGVTTGAFADVLPGMTLLIGSAPGLDDYGRQRVREVNDAGATAIVVWVGRSSRGTHDGELTLVDNAYVTVWDDRRLWAKIPYIDADGEIFKDSNLEVGDRTTEPPPVAVMGAGTAGTAVDDELIVLHNGQLSYAVADGATITDFLWDIGDGTLVSGLLTDDNITVSYPVGFRHPSLTVTDSNGKTHKTERPVFVDDPDERMSFDAFQIESHRITEQGQAMTVRILADMPRLTYPDGTLAMVWGFEPAGAANRDHLLIIGWLDVENANMAAGRNGLLRDTTLTILDVAGRLDLLPGFPQSVADDATRIVGVVPTITWNYMTTPNLDKYLHYLLHWHSTAMEVADVTWYPEGSQTGSDYEFLLLASDGDSLWNQVDRRARAFVPDRVLTCDRAGRIAVVPDPMLAEVASRTAVVQAAIDESEWSDIRWTYQRSPRVHWLRAGAILAGSTQPIGTVFSIAPGDTPGQGVGELTQGEQLALSQSALNQATGHRYARANSRLGLVTITLLQDDGGAGAIMPWAEIEPARKEWVTITVSAATAARRGLTWTAARGLPKELSIRYVHTRQGLARELTLTLELETVGEPGHTVVKPVDVPAVGEPPTPPGAWSPPLPGDESVYYGDMAAYVLWTSAHVFRTWNIQAVPPTWELIDTGITGTIYSGQYIHVDEDTIGMWLMTSTAIWWCTDIMATTPTWAEVLPIATVRAAEATPSSGLVHFKTMFPYWSAPGHLCVATGPLAIDSDNIAYQHAYFWVTEDYGANWTHVDMNTFLFTNSGMTRGYCYSSLYAMNIYRSAPGTIWCVRMTPNWAGLSKAHVFISSDLGYTWTQGVLVDQDSNNGQTASLLNPFPDAGDPSYVAIGSIGVDNRANLLKSTDGWATKTTITDPSGYGGLSNLWRVNKRSFDDLHIMAWMRHTAETQMHLMESNDGGSTWTMLYDSGLQDTSISNVNTGNATGVVVNCSAHNTPNGWSPDDGQWVVIRADNTSGPTTNLVQLTLDNFATRLDKTGNLIALGGAWAEGANDGFALPRTGPNA